MKTFVPKSLATVACAVALFAAPQFTTRALDQWETTYIAANPDSSIVDFATHAGSTVVGSQLVWEARSGYRYTTLVSSSDGGTTWIESQSVAGEYWRVSISDSGEVYLGSVAGQVIRSGDFGHTWREVWNLPGGGGFNTLHDLEAGSGGTVFAAVDIKPAWMLVAGVPDPSAASGMTWAVVDTYQPEVKTVTEPQCILVDRRAGVGGADVIYVGGWQNHSKQGYSWVLRKSADGGNNWFTASIYQLVPGATTGGISTLAKTPDGTLYAAGRLVTSVIKNKGSTTHIASSLIRRSTDGGLSWTTVVQTSRKVFGLAVSANGGVFASYGDSVEVSSNKGASWDASDIVSPAYGNSLVADGLGHIHHGGQTLLNSGAWTGLIRTLPSSFTE